MDKKNLTTEETFALAVQNQQKNNFQVAENLYKEILKTNPNHVDAHANLGMVFRKFASNVALKFEPFAKKISMVLFVIVLLGAIFAEKDNIISYFADAGLITLVLNILSYTIYT